MKLTPVLSGPTELRQRIRARAVEGLTASFPMDVRGQKLELQDIAVHPRDFGPEAQKQAILEGASLHEAVKGTLVLRSPLGKVVDQVKNFTLLHLPYLTERHSFIIDGNEYQVGNQIRQKPGVYTRRRGNDELETAFNLSKGSNFRLSLDPAKGHPYMEYGSTLIPLYPILRRLGLAHSDISRSWGAPVALSNAAAFDAPKKADAALEKLYGKLVHPAKRTHPTSEAKIDAVRAAFARTSMDPEVNEVTLGHPHERVTPFALLDASKRLLSVFKSGEAVDDRDSLAFKSFHAVDDFVRERIALDARALATKVKARAAAKGTIRELLGPAPFSTGVRAFISGSQLSAIPTQINPMEIIDHAVRVTSLGEGGISSDRAIPMEARELHPTHFGLLDPVRTPESLHAGVDIRAAMLAHRDDHGNLYTPVRDVKTGQVHSLSAKDLAAKVIAFPGQRQHGLVDAMKHGRVEAVPAKDVEYEIIHASQLYSPTTNLIPFMECIQGNRATMGSKMQTQALPLVEREVPLVQVGATLLSEHGETPSSFEKELGKLVVATAPVAGRVAKIDKEYIYIEPSKPSGAPKQASEPDLVRVPYETNFPFASKTYLHQELKVKAGDEVAQDEPLTESNFTRGGTLALGKNMRVAYLPYYGLNSNDAIVISEAAARKLTSEHMYKEVLDIDADVTVRRDLHRQWFGAKYTSDQYEKLDPDGVVKKGASVIPHDILIAAVRRGKLTPTDTLLGNIRKTLATPYRDGVREWHHDFPGEVIDVYKSPKRIVVTVKTREPVLIGDKLSSRYGAKGVVSHIVPDHRMVQDEKGRPIDVLLTSAGVISRINPAQIIETAVAKVAEKTGQPILVENFTGRDNVKWAKDLLEKHGVRDKETVFDPVSGKKIPGVRVGPQYTFRLFKTTETNYAGRGTGGYDVNRQPTKGGDEGAKALGKMEVNALIAHNARNVLREAATLKSEANDEFWRAVQLGLPLPALKRPFVYDKLLAMLQGSGIRIDQRGNQLTLGPMTDADVSKLSSGPIENEKLVKARNLEPERGGFFDPTLTGGPTGTRWAHVELAEPLVNPIFAEPARRLLGMSTKEFDAFHFEQGGAAVKKRLDALDLVAKERELRETSQKLSGTRLDDALKQLKYIAALNKAGLTPGNAYVISKLPVVPPVMRPILPGRGGGDMVVGDSNYLYQTAFLHNSALGRQVASAILPPKEHEQLRRNLFNAVGAVSGTHETDNQKLLKRNVKGFLAHLSGKTTPKSSFFQKKIEKRQQDLSGRGTMVPDGSLGMDQVGIPEEMLWSMFGKFVIGRLVRRGFPALKAQEMVEERHPAARDALLAETNERPVMFNRAPTLHRYNIIGAYAVPVAGKTIRTNPFCEAGLNADYDGDTLQVHTPVLPNAVEDVKLMTMSHLLFADKQKDDLLVVPRMEATLGLHLATRPGNGKPRHFQSREAAMAAYKRGEVALNDIVEFG